jgi:demethylmenaquinone methyltransferase/2-methoxy-6-polyprenyl-1,4-benzoquinol methylase
LDLPAEVQLAQQRAQQAGFVNSCEPDVGQLLMVLAAAVPLFGRVLEIGTGAGVGTAWLATGLERRPDVEAISIERDVDLVALARSGPWPKRVRLIHGDVFAVLDGLGQFDLVFADAPGGKWEGLERTLRALRPSGVLVVDDMRPAAWHDAEHQATIQQIRGTLLGHPELVATELEWSSGVMLATRRR